MLAPLIVTENKEFKGFISLAGSLRRLEDIVLEQAETMAAQSESMSEEEKEAYVAVVAEDVETIKSLTADAEASSDEYIQGYSETYWQSINQMNSYQLTLSLAEEDYPILVLQGKNDFQVLYETDFPLWQEALAEDENASFIAYDGLSHVFMPGSKEKFDGSVYNEPAHVDEQVISDMAEWIVSQ